MYRDGELHNEENKNNQQSKTLSTFSACYENQWQKNEMSKSDIIHTIMQGTLVEQDQTEYNYIVIQVTEDVLMFQ